MGVIGLKDIKSSSEYWLHGQRAKFGRLKHLRMMRKIGKYPFLFIIPGNSTLWLKACVFFTNSVGQLVYLTDKLKRFEEKVLTL